MAVGFIGGGNQSTGRKPLTSHKQKLSILSKGIVSVIFGFLMSFLCIV